MIFLKNKIIKHLNQGTLLEISSKKTVGKAVGKIFCSFQSLKSTISKSVNIINNPYQTVYVPVEAINYQVYFKGRRSIKIGGLKHRIVGIIANGDWDTQNKQIFTEMWQFIGFQERFVEGKEWEDTIYYKVFFDHVGSTKWFEYTTWFEFKQKDLKRWDALYHEVVHKGYKTQKYCLTLNRPGHGPRPENEIEVGISRHGEILFIDGKHRLAIAKLIGIKEVPVIVNYWHEEYIKQIKMLIKNKKLTPSIAIEPAINKFNARYHAGYTENGQNC